MIGFSFDENPMQEKDHLPEMTAFLDEIGIQWKYDSLDGKTFVPGLDIINGILHIDREKMLYPGDVLHEAGHIAVAPADVRPALCGSTLSQRQGSDGEEIVALLWSYAALKHLKLPPEFVFHPHGYKGQSDWIIERFTNGEYVGMPLLEWMGLTISPEKAASKGVAPFPHLIKWLRD